jgi:phospholipase C
MGAAKESESAPRKRPRPRPNPSGPIQRVAITVTENHDFDNYFGAFPGTEGMTLLRSPNPRPTDSRQRRSAWLTRPPTAVRQQFVEQHIPAYSYYAPTFGLPHFNACNAAADDLSDGFDYH